jgi:hypothetical protein
MNKIKATIFECSTPYQLEQKAVYGKGCRISIEPNSPACIGYHKLDLLRDGFEDNISERSMVEIVDRKGSSVFWGSFDSLIQKLSEK